MKKIISICVLIGCWYCSIGQTADLFIPPSAQLFFFSKDTASIFGNISNAGIFGQQTGNYIYFFGRRWINDINASFIDESVTGNRNIGGIVDFQQPNPNAGNLGRQSIYGGYNAEELKGPSFPSILLNNIAGLTLEDNTDVSIKNLFQFNKGKTFFNNSNLVIGDRTHKGLLKNFDNSRYFVTGTDPVGGFLHFTNIATGDSIVFPIGVSESNYTPMAITNKTLKENYKGRVFSGTYEEGLSGNSISQRSVNKTWILASSNRPVRGNLDIQHNTVEEGFAFFDNRYSSYISVSLSGKWDTAATYGPPVTPGRLTEGNNSPFAAMNRRIFTDNTTGNILILTKLTNDTTKYAYPKEITLFTATRLNPIQAILNWTVQFPERMIRYEIQRKKTGDADWTTVASVDASSQQTEYSWADNDVYYQDPIFYRIIVYYQQGNSRYTEIRSIPGVGNRFEIVYPNPTMGLVTIRVFDFTKVKSIGLYTVLGQKLEEKNMSAPSVQFDLSRYAAGVYLFVLTSQNDKNINTLKVIKYN